MVKFKRNFELEFIKYTNGIIIGHGKTNEKDSTIFVEVKDNILVEEQANHIFNIWSTSFNFYNRNIQELLNAAKPRESFIFYQIKIILNSMHEYLDKMTKLLSKVFNNKETRIVDNKSKNKTKGEWMLSDILSEVYDDSFSYKLCYNLRNYMQHVNDVGVFLYEDAYNGRKIMIDIKTYCENHSGISKSFKEAVEKIPFENRRYDLDKLIKELNSNIKFINEKILSLLHPIIFENAISYNMVLLYLYSKYALKKDVNAIEYDILHNGQRISKICFANISKSKSFINKNFNIYFKIKPFDLVNSFTPLSTLDSNSLYENDFYILESINRSNDNICLIKAAINKFVDLLKE